MRTRFQQMERNMAEERERRDAELHQAAQRQFADYVAGLRSPVATEALRNEGSRCRETPAVAPLVPPPVPPPTPLAPIIENPAPQASVVPDPALAEARDEAERFRSEYQALLWEMSSEGNTGGPDAPAAGGVGSSQDPPDDSDRRGPRFGAEEREPSPATSAVAGTTARCRATVLHWPGRLLI